MLLSPRSFRMKVNGSFYPPSSSGVGTLPTRPDKPSPRRTLRSAIHEEASVKTKEQDEYGTSQPSIRHHPPRRSAMREYAVAPIHTSGIAMRHGGPRDAT